jgi:hypothetical protein
MYARIKLDRVSYAARSSNKRTKDFGGNSGRILKIARTMRLKRLFVVEKKRASSAVNFTYQPSSLSSGGFQSCLDFSAILQPVQNVLTVYFYSAEAKSIIKVISESDNEAKREVELIKFGQ